MLKTTLRSLVLAVGVCLASAPAWAQANQLYLNSQPGDYVGQGQQVSYTAGSFEVFRDAIDTIFICFHTDAYEHWWSLYFSAPQGQVLSPGMYEAATRHPYESPTHPGLDVFGDYRGCDTLAGRFVVLDVSYAPNGDVQTLAADFEQHCEGAAPALYGAIRFNSSIPIAPRLSIAGAAVIEEPSQTPMTFTISLSQPGSGPVTVGYSTADGTAVAGSDYIASSGTVTFTPPETAKQIAIPVLNDGAAQGDKYFHVDLVNPTGAALAASEAKGTIVDGDGPLTFLVLDSQAGDPVGQGRRRKLTFLDGVFSVRRGDDQSVFINFSSDTHWDLHFAAPAGAPVAPGMYEGATLWPGRSPTHPGLSVSGEGRACGSGKGRFRVLEATLGPSGDLQSFAADFEQHCQGATPALYGAIRINSTLSVVPRLSVSNAAVVEEPSPMPMVFTISLSEPVSAPVTVGYATSDGTAASGSDYVATSGTLTFAPSETSKEIAVQVLNDGAAQGEQYFYVDLADPSGAILGSGQGKGTIVDSEGPQTFLVLNSQPGDYVGQGQPQRLTILDGVFSVSRRNYDRAVNVHFRSETWWDLLFAPLGDAELVPGMYEGAWRGPFESPTHPGLTVFGDNRGCNTLTGRFLVLEAVYAPNWDVESFAADFEQHCEGQTPALYGAIRFNSTLPVVPRLSVNDAAVIEGPSQTPMIFTISLSQPAASPITVDYATADGTALAGSGYIATSGTVTFAPSETSKPITVQVLRDGVAQGDRDFYVNLANPSGAILASNPATGRIVDGDGPQSFLWLNSQPGDYIGQGLVQKLTVLDGAFSADRTYAQGVHVRFWGDTWWDAYFGGPDGAPLGPGTYEGAEGWLPQSPGHPGLSVSGDGRGCTERGRFVVLEAVYGGAGDVQRFAANFQQLCAGQTAALFGAVRFNSLAGASTDLGSSSADLATSVVSAPSQVGRDQPLTYMFTITNNGPDPVAGATATFSSNPTLAGQTWSCSAIGGATCGSGSVGVLTDSMNVPVGGIVTYVVEAPATQLGSVAAALCASAPGGIIEWNASNNCAHVATSVLSVSRGDLDGDGFSDILWQKPSTRDVSAWYMKGATLQSAVVLARSAVGWSVVGVGDFIRDGLADILLQQSPTGDLQVWNWSGTPMGPTNPGGRGPEFEVVGIGDFDGDRRPDILWRDRDSEALSVWLMDGRNRRTETALPLTRYAWSWRVSAIADLDGDGQADLVMQRPNDDHVLVCFVKGLKVVRQAFVYPGAPSGYRLAATGDYDGDGRDDLVWQNQRTGGLLLWYMKGNAVKAAGGTTPATHAGTGWKVVGPR